MKRYLLTMYGGIESGIEGPFRIEDARHKRAMDIMLNDITDIPVAINIHDSGVAESFTYPRPKDEEDDSSQ